MRRRTPRIVPERGEVWQVDFGMAPPPEVDLPVRSSCSEPEMWVTERVPAATLAPAEPEAEATMHTRANQKTKCLRDIDPVFYDLYDRMAVGFNYVDAGLAYRKDMVSKAPAAWADLWDPAYKAQLMLPDVGGGFAHELIVIAALLNGVPHVVRGYELPFFNIHCAAAQRGGHNKISLPAEKSGDLQHIGNFGDFANVGRLMDLRLIRDLEAPLTKPVELIGVRR